MFDRHGPRDRDDARRPHPAPAPAPRPHDRLGVPAILALQRTAGNAAVARMLARTVSQTEQGQLRQAITGKDAAARQNLLDAQNRVLALNNSWVDFISRLMAWATTAQPAWTVAAKPTDDLALNPMPPDAVRGMANKGTATVTMAANARAGELDSSLAHEQTHAVLYALFGTSKPFNDVDFSEEFGQAILTTMQNVEQGYNDASGSVRQALQIALDVLRSMENNYGGLVPKNQGPIPSNPTDAVGWMNRWGFRVFNEVLPHFTEIVVKVTQQQGLDVGYVYTAMRPLLDFLKQRFFPEVQQLTSIPTPALPETPLPVTPPPLDLAALQKRVADMLAQTNGATPTASAPISKDRRAVLEQLRALDEPPRRNLLGREIRAFENDPSAGPACDAAQRAWPERDRRWGDVKTAVDRAIHDRGIAESDVKSLRGKPAAEPTKDAPEPVRELERRIEAAIAEALGLLDELSRLPS